TFRPPYQVTPAMTNAVATGPDELTITSESFLLRIHHDTAGADPVIETGSIAAYLPAWALPGTTEVFTASFAQVQRNPDPWGGGNWGFSTIALDGKPTLTMFNAIRGTSPSNIWVVGESYALHKSSP